MSKQVITIGYLKEFVSGILDVSIAYDNNAYCPTYKELTDGSICKYYVSDSNPTKTTNGIRIPTCTIDSNENDTYSSNQLVIRQDLELLYQQLQSVTVTPDKTSGVSCCGESVGLTTTAYFKLVTKKEGGTTTAETSTNATVTATYSEDKDYTSIASGKLKFEKNSIAYQRGVTESVAARSSKVTASYTYSGVTKTDDETVTQNGNSAKAWSHISDTTTSIAISPTSMSFGSCESSQTYSVTRYYDSYYERYDQCGALLDTRTDKNNGVVTPSKAEKTGSFTVTTSKVSVATNTGAYRTGTLTVTYDGKTDSINLAQAASQQGYYYSDPYDDSYALDVSLSPWDDLPCNGGTTQATATYWHYFKDDWEYKDHCGTTLSSGTHNHSEHWDVTSQTTWTTNRGTISSKGVLTFPASSINSESTKVTGTYGGYSDSSTCYQGDCKPAELTPVTVKFCGEYESQEWHKANGSCEMPQSEQIITSDISYEIIGGDDEVLKHIVIYAYAVKYHLGKHIEWQKEFTPTSRSGNLENYDFEGAGELIASGLCSEYEQTQKVYYWAAELASGTDKYKLTVDDRVNKDCDDSGGSSGGGDETPKPVVSQIYIINNCPGSVDIEYTGPTGGKQNKTLPASGDSSYSIVTSGQSDFQVSIPAGHYESNSGNFIYVEFKDGNGNNLGFTALGNTKDEGGGCKAMPNSTGASSESSICVTNAKYQVCATILFQAKN